MLDTALKQGKRDKAAFAMLAKEGERLAETGKVLADAANRERLTAEEQDLDLLTRIATRAGPVSDALSDAARAFNSGEIGRGEAARRFLGDVRRADLTQLARGAGDGGDRPGDAGAADRRSGPRPRRCEDAARTGKTSAGWARGLALRLPLRRLRRRFLLWRQGRIDQPLLHS